MAWTDPGPVYAPAGMPMVLPRSGSVAAQAGLQKGDVILAVDGKAIGSIPVLQETIRDHKSGEGIHPPQPGTLEGVSLEERVQYRTRSIALPAWSVRETSLRRKEIRE
jgi:predicted metalloprotease with PDZ domain